MKWIVVAVGAVVSFAIIDYGELRLERFRATAENDRELLNSYLKATDSPVPEVWERKLNLILNSANDEQTKEWARKELNYNANFAALNALYRETLKVASQLVEPNRLSEPDRVQARARYNQLYWADLPYAGESEEVESAMVEFRNQLLLAEKTGQGLEAQEQWDELSRRLLRLSEALRNSTPRNAPELSSD